MLDISFVVLIVWHCLFCWFCVVGFVVGSLVILVVSYLYLLFVFACVVV